MQQDSLTSSYSSSCDVPQLISNARYNEAEITPASQQYIDSLDREFVNGLETIPVTTEAPWDKAGEILLRDWMDEAKDTAIDHRRTGYKLKKRYHFLSIAVIVTAAFVFLVSSLFPCTTEESYRYIQVCFSFVSLIVANTSTFFNYGARYQKHFDYEGKYCRFAIDIQEILITQTEFRPPKDRTMVEYKERKGNLVTSAPEL